MLDIADTIAAIAVPNAGGARGIVRLSGTTAVSIARKCFDSSGGRRIHDLRHPTVVPGKLRIVLANRNSTRVPCDAYVWPHSSSYTRQPTVELHTLGSPPLLQATLRRVCEIGARLAEPGEFTLRAFLAGRLDLTQAEAVLGVIDARGDDAFRTALRQLAGGLAQPLANLRSSLIELLADLEAGLDFVEEDIEFVTQDEMIRRIDVAADEVDKLMDRLSNRGDSSSLPRFVLVGAPNSGKSSLFNALTSRFGVGAPQRALVSDIAGTTRDYLIARLAIDDIQFELVDTAGVAAAPLTNDLDASAQQITHDVSSRADMLLRCIDEPNQLNDLPTADTRCLVILTKHDLHRCTVAEAFSVSIVTNFGIEPLAAELRRRAMLHTSEESSGMVATTSSRCASSLRAAHDGLARMREVVMHAAGEELAAAELRGVLYQIGRVVGAVYTDDLLDQIFGRFCIGK